ncbi:hypothetical protein [Burkholderia diffusa]|uniref:hypothetical protein n=1 Tax=Burkholderia diffusa TaxID=488732 RepID=UPI00158B066C|nr:hypothetical protein [Burkholderia diffusa]
MSKPDLSLEARRPSWIAATALRSQSIGQFVQTPANSHPDLVFPFFILSRNFAALSCQRARLVPTTDLSHDGSSKVPVNYDQFHRQ